MPNDNSTTLTMDDLHAATSAEVNAAVSAEERVASGIYLGKTTAVFAKKMADDSEYDAGRSLANLAVDLYTLDAATRVGKIFLKVSWEPRYNRGGKLDNPSRRYAELIKALRVEKCATPADLFDAAKAQIFAIKVRESFKVHANDLHYTHDNARIGADGDAWVVIPAAEDAVFNHYNELGYESRSMVDRVFKAS